MKTYRLNLKKPNNYAYFDPKSRLHLTLLNPVGKAVENKNIVKAIKNKTLIALADNSKKETAEKTETSEDKTLASNKEATKTEETIDEVVDTEEEDIDEVIDTDTEDETDTEDDDGKVPCQYCGKEYSKNGVKRHESSCDKNPDNK